jgi:host factor-I protein
MPNVQDVFLNHLRESRTPVTIFLANGIKLQGTVAGFDAFSVLLRRDGHSQLVYKHALSCIMPVTPVPLFEEAKRLRHFDERSTVTPPASSWSLTRASSRKKLELWVLPTAPPTAARDGGLWRLACEALSLSEAALT